MQPDNRRAGGPTEWMEIAAISDGFGVELASHGGGPANMNVLCAIPNAIYMESGGKQKLVNGEVLAPEEPGMSSQPAADFIANTKSEDPTRSRTTGHRLWPFESLVRRLQLDRKLAGGIRARAFERAVIQWR